MYKTQFLYWYCVFVVQQFVGCTVLGIYYCIMNDFCTRIMKYRCVATPALGVWKAANRQFGVLHVPPNRQFGGLNEYTAHKYTGLLSIIGQKLSSWRPFAWQVHASVSRKSVEKNTREHHLDNTPKNVRPRIRPGTRVASQLASWN